MPARSLGMDSRDLCGSLVGDLLEGRGNVVHIGECRGRTYDSRQHQRFFVQPLGGGAEALVILGVSGVMTKRKRPSIVIERRKVQRTNIPGTQGDAFRLERLDKPITRHACLSLVILYGVGVVDVLRAGLDDGWLDSTRPPQFF